MNVTWDVTEVLVCPLVLRSIASTHPLITRDTFNLYCIRLPDSLLRLRSIPLLIGSHRISMLVSTFPRLSIRAPLIHSQPREQVQVVPLSFPNDPSIRGLDILELLDVIVTSIQYLEHAVPGRLALFPGAEMGFVDTEAAIGVKTAGAADVGLVSGTALDAVDDCLDPLTNAPDASQSA